ncbi:MAG: porin [Alphaproteobacteria bacterium]
MVGKTPWLAGASLAAILMLAGSGSAFAGSSSGGPSNAELQQEIEDLQYSMQQSQISSSQRVNALNDQLSKVATSGWWSNTSISGRMYYNASWIDNEVNGVKSGNINGVGFDIKRFYFGVDHKFNDTYSANLTTDFQFASAISATELFIKKAYLQAKYSDALTIRLGATDLPWVPFVEDLYGYRFVENVIIDRTKFGTSSDWGIHASGKLLKGGMLNYAVAVVNGSGYKSPSGAGNATHFKSVDVEGRVNLNVQDFIFAVGGYYGKLGKDVQTANDFHTATRLDALVAYKTAKARLGFEYFNAHNFNSVTTAGPGDRAEGFGGFASYQFTPMWGVFGRYDYVEPNRVPAVKVKDNYFNVGIDWTPTKIVDFALVYKRDKADHGTIGTSNGTIGGAVDGTYDEVGIFSQFRW